MESWPMKKIVINQSYGEFCLSHTAFTRLRDLGQREALQEVDLGAHWPQGVSPQDPTFNKCGVLIPRDDQKLVQVVEELGLAANGHCADLKVVEVPQDVKWILEKSGGIEHISEVHRTWS